MVAVGLTVGLHRIPQAERVIDERREPLFASYRVNANFIPPSHWLHDPQVGGGRIIGEACTLSTSSLPGWSDPEQCHCPGAP